MCDMSDTCQEKYLAVTKIETLNIIYEWKIYNLSLAGKKIGQFIDSPMFSSRTTDKYQWFLRLYPKGKREEYVNYVSLFLHLKSKNPNIDVEYRFCILNDKGKKVNKIKNTYHYEGEKCGSGFSRFLCLSDLKCKAKGLSSYGSLIIQCDLTAGVNITNFSVENKVEFNELKYQLKVYDEFEELLRNKDLTDIILVANGQEFHAHKAILAARSPVFLRMFKTDMKEKAECKIVFTDFNSDVLTEMLRYIYTGKVENIDKYLNDLLFIAEKYVLEGLKMMCEQCFQCKISTKNAVNTLILADQYNCNKLKTQVIKFIIAHGKDIVKSPEFKMLKNLYPSLMFEFLLQWH